VRIPSEAIISETKLTRYLLLLKPRNDKSKFLAQAGFTLDNWEVLVVALRVLTTTVDAIADRTDEYGTYYRAIGTLQGVNGINLKVVTIWLHRSTDQQFQFLTLVPNKETTG
jgi:carbon starvation protein CstA